MILTNEILQVRTLFLLKCYGITTKEQLEAHTLKIGDKPGYYSKISVTKSILDNINEYLYDSNS